jgi:hypothetical protein
MRRDVVAILRRSCVVTLVLAFASCTDNYDPTQPSARAYVTPTGLVSPNPPQIFTGAGDISSCSNSGDEATAKLLDAIPEGLVYNLGDDAYDNGTTSEFACYNSTWGRHKSRTKPSPGNHEYNTSGAKGYYAYFGAVAGDPTKGYYSFDLGAWHIISLNSNISRSVGSAQDTWLAADLAAHPNQCTLAYWHHPLYSSSGSSGGVTLTSMRPFWDRLYAAHADLVLNGHRHFYDRMAQMKPDGKADPVNGIRSIVAGTGGIGGGSVSGAFPTSQVRNGDTFGVLKLYLYDDSYAWKFVPVAGKTFTDSGSTACHSSGGGGGQVVSPTNSTVAAAPTSFTAGSGSSTITVTARDGNNTIMTGASVSLSSSGTGNTLTPSSGTTNASGVFTSTLTSTVAEVKDVSASINGVAINQHASVTVNASGPAVSPSLSTVGASPTSFTAGGSSTVTVTVKDGSGNALSGISVTLSATGSGNSFTQPAATNGSGVTTGTFSSTGAGSHTVTAVAGGVTLNQQPVVTVSAGAISAGQSTVTAQPSTITVGTGTSTITVTVKDAFGNPLAGSNVVLAATGTGNTLAGGGATNASGVATGTLSSSVSETKTVSATADGVGITQTASVTVNPPGSGIAHALLTQGHNVNNQSVYTTASIAPAPNTLITVAVTTHQSSAAAPSPTLTGGGMSSWTLVANVAYSASTPLDRVSVYRAMSASPGSGPITITSSVTVSNCQWIVSQWSGVDQSGTNGSGAIVQSGTTSGITVNGLTVTLAAFGSTNNVGYGVFGVTANTADATPGTGFTTIAQEPSGESSVGDVFAERAANKNVINAVWSSKSGGGIGVEIKAGP